MKKLLQNQIGATYLHAETLTNSQDLGNWELLGFTWEQNTTLKFFFNFFEIMTSWRVINAKYLGLCLGDDALNEDTIEKWLESAVGHFLTF